jgi:predicted DNA-binding transcriptional regulator AlpA
MSAVRKITSARRVLTKRQVLDRVPLSYPTIWKLMREGKFPRSRSLGTDSQKVVWFEHEIDRWLTALPERELKAPASKSVRS